MVLLEPSPRRVVSAKAFFHGKEITINENTPDFQNLLLGQFEEEASLCKACDTPHTIVQRPTLMRSA